MGTGKKQNNNRKYLGAKGPRFDNYKFRCEEATERQKAYDALSVQERIDLLDRRLGKGVGATKQRAKLQALLEKKNTPVAKPQETAKDRPRAKDRRAYENETR